MPDVLITGANRGLGLEFARQYAAEGWSVLATARSPSAELVALGVEVVPLDMRDAAAVATFAERVDAPLDLLIANAGVYGPRAVQSADDAAAWLEVLRVNTIAPVLLVQALLPRLEAAGGKAVAISSRMGSIADATIGSIAYRSSKAALNMAWHVLAAETCERGVSFVLFNPGWVKTDMGGAAAPVAAPDSIAAMRATIERLTLADSGSFIERDGTAIPW